MKAILAASAFLVLCAALGIISWLTTRNPDNVNDTEDWDHE